MDIVASNSKRYVSVDSRNNESTEVVKLKNTNNEFTGKFLVQDGSATKDINDVFVKGIRVGENGPVRTPVNGIVTVPPSGGGGIQNVSLTGCEGSRIDGVVKTNDQGQMVVEIPIENLECDEISVNRLLIGGVSITDIIPNLQRLGGLTRLSESGTSLNDTIRKLNAVIDALTSVATSQQYVESSGN